MKLTFLTFLCFTVYFSKAQNDTTELYIDPSLIVDEQYTMSWQILTDGKPIELAEIKTTIRNVEDLVYIITNVFMNSNVSPWVDTTIVKAKDFSPAYHTSTNSQRSMQIKYENQIIGFHKNKQSGHKKNISDEFKPKHFDSSSYTYLLKYLLLKEGFKAKIPLYDIEKGYTSATIQNVESSTFNYKGQQRPTWRVTTYDDIQDNSVLVIHYIDKKNREILYQEIIPEAGRKMCMVHAD